MSTNNPKLVMVKPKGSLQKKIGENQLQADIIAEIGKMGNIDALKDDKSLLEHVCKYVENANSIEKFTGKEKKDFVIKVMIKLYPSLNNEQDIKIMNDDIDYICSKKIIKKVSLFKITSKAVINFVKKKFL